MKVLELSEASIIIESYELSARELDIAEVVHYDGERVVLTQRKLHSGSRHKLHLYHKDVLNDSLKSLDSRLLTTSTKVERWDEHFTSESPTQTEIHSHKYLT